MKKILKIILTIFLTGSSGYAQLKNGIINDPDGFVNLRSGRGVSFKIIEEIREGEKFKFLRDAQSDWWYVESEFGKKGYMHKSRIQPYDEQYTVVCQCDDFRAFNAPNFAVSINGSPISLCGFLLQRQSKYKIKVTEFVIYDCENKKTLGFYRATKDCWVEFANDQLIITQVENLPSGRNWSWRSTPVLKTFISKRDSMLVSSPGEKAFFNDSLTSANISEFVNRIERIKALGNDNIEKEFADYSSREELLGRLLVAAMAGNEQCKKLFKDFADYFGFTPDGHLAEDYAHYRELLEFYE